MVVTVLPATLEIGVTQERTGCPLRCMVQAPHSDIPHPNFGPVIPRVSRKTHRSGIAGGTSTVCAFPFNVNLPAAIRPSSDCLDRSSIPWDFSVCHSRQVKLAASLVLPVPV